LRARILDPSVQVFRGQAKMNACIDIVEVVSSSKAPAIAEAEAISGVQKQASCEQAGVEPARVRRDAEMAPAGLDAETRPEEREP
jgi:hypothetical protein